jgi:putative peptidoglycan lipid II flippase
MTADESPVAAPPARSRPTGIGWVDTMLGRLFPQGALLLSVLTFGSYVVGLLRDRVQARTFGAGAELDAYNAAFQIPEVALGVLVGSGLAAPFVPIFLGLRQEDEKAARQFAGTILSLATLIILVATPILFIFAPETVDLVARGFDERQRTLYVDLFRLMLITPLLFAISDVLGEILVAERRFLWYALAPIVYNGGLVAGTILLAPRIGIFGPAIGAILGAVLHLAVRVWGIRGSTVRLRPALAVRTAAIRQFGLLMLPKMLSHPIEPLTFLQLNSLASTLAIGGISSVSFARNFQSVPVTVIGISFALAAFPALSAAAAAGDRRAFGRILGRNVLSITLLTVVAAVALFALSRFAIEVLLGGDQFTPEQVDRTVIVLAAFTLAIPFESLTHLLSRAIYATRNTLLQVLASLASFGVTIAAAYALAPEFGILAVPLGFAIGMMAKVALLSIALVPRIRGLRPGETREELIEGN